MLFNHKSYVSYNAISREMFVPLALARCMLDMSIANILFCGVCGISFSADNSRQLIFASNKGSQLLIP